MTRIQKIKQKIYDYRGEIIGCALVTGIVALTIAAAKAEAEAAEKQQEAREELDRYIVEQNRQGKTVYQLADGSYIGVTVE